MKKLILLLASVAFMVNVQAQQMDKNHTEKSKVKDANVPAAVSGAFASAHAGVKDIEWKKDGVNYEAEYDGPNGKDIYVTYDASGKLIRTKEEVADKDLPGGIMAYIKKNYDEDEARHAYRVTDAAGAITYKVKMKGDQLFFDSSGNYIKVIKAEKKSS